MCPGCERCSCFFFFQAEDGIRDYKVTGVQTCALPISPGPRSVSCWAPWRWARSCCCRRCITCFACSRGVPDGSVEHSPRYPPSGEAARNEAQEHPPHTEQLVAERSDERCHDEVDEGLEQCHVAYRSAPRKCSDT